MVTGKIDLTVGYGIVLWHVLGHQPADRTTGLPWPAAVLIVVALSPPPRACSMALLVEVARIDAFIATLGTGTVLYALALWYTGGRQVVGILPQGLPGAELAPSCSACRSRAITCVGLARGPVVRARTRAARPLPLRHRRPTPRRRRSTASRSERLTVLAFVASGTLTGIAGVLLRRQAAHRSGQRWGWSSCCPPSSAPSWARPPSSPGRVNVWGTVVGVDHPGGRHRRHPADRRLLLGRAALQRHDAARRHRHRGLRPAPPAGAAGRRLEPGAARGGRLDARPASPRPDRARPSPGSSGDRPGAAPWAASRARSNSVWNGRAKRDGRGSMAPPSPMPATFHTLVGTGRRESGDVVAPVAGHTIRVDPLALGAIGAHGNAQGMTRSMTECPSMRQNGSEADGPDGRNKPGRKIPVDGRDRKAPTLSWLVAVDAVFKQWANSRVSAQAFVGVRGL